MFKLNDDTRARALEHPRGRTGWGSKRISIEAPDAHPPRKPGQMTCDSPLLQAEIYHGNFGEYFTRIIAPLYKSHPYEPI